MRTKMMALLAVYLSWNTPVEATQYSCLSIITEAKAIGKWDALKGWIDEAGLSDEWGKCSYVSDAYPQYAAITNALVAGGVLTQEEADRILHKSVDTAVPDAILMALYRREMSSESGRTKWHGKRVKTEEDMTNLVQTFTYEDGYSFSQPFSKATPLTVEQRFALERRRREEEEKRRLAQLPPGLQAVQTQRQANDSTTNEVTVHFGQTGAEGRPAVYNRP